LVKNNGITRFRKLIIQRRPGGSGKRRSATNSGVNKESRLFAEANEFIHRQEREKELREHRGVTMPIVSLVSAPPPSAPTAESHTHHISLASVANNPNLPNAQAYAQNVQQHQHTHAGLHSFERPAAPMTGGRGRGGYRGRGRGAMRRRMTTASTAGESDIIVTYTVEPEQDSMSFCCSALFPIAQATYFMFLHLLRF